ADEDVCDSGDCGELRLVGRVEDDGSALGRSGAQELLVLVVAVDDQLVAGEPGRTREGELALGRDVGTDALTTQEAEHSHVRERLRPVEDTPAGSDGLEER